MENIQCWAVMDQYDSSESRLVKFNVMLSTSHIKRITVWQLNDENLFIPNYVIIVIYPLVVFVLTIYFTVIGTRRQVECRYPHYKRLW